MLYLNLIELNEINFEFVAKYIDKYPGRFKGFEKLKSFNQITTKSENLYEQIEPWIQWPSVHTCKSFAEHKVFRLGDIVNFSGDQIFELIERSGYSVGCVSPMNAKNNLKRPAFFIPDPWTATKPDNSLISRSLHQALRQAVNDNSQGKIDFTTYLTLIFVILTKTRKKNWIRYATLFLKRKKRWNKALFLDLLLSDIFISLKNKNNENFSCLFLNAFAHIQHHYILNSEMYDGELKNDINYLNADEDPVLDAIELYDEIIYDLLKIFRQKFIFATGLRQVPVDRKITYYRLRNHNQFLSKLGLENFSVNPRMTRDFLINFNSSDDLETALAILSNASCDGIKLFGEIEAREASLFVTLTYSLPVAGKSIIGYENHVIDLSEEFIFVAIKNGHHDSVGYAITNYETEILKNNDHVYMIGKEILHFFKVQKA